MIYSRASGSLGKPFISNLEELRGLPLGQLFIFGSRLGALCWLQFWMQEFHRYATGDHHLHHFFINRD